MASEHEHHHHAGPAPEGMDRAVGVSLVLGFLFMLLIDQLASMKANASSGPSGSLPVATSDIDSSQPAGKSSTHEILAHLLMLLLLRFRKAWS